MTTQVQDADVAGYLTPILSPNWGDQLARVRTAIAAADSPFDANRYPVLPCNATAGNIIVNLPSAANAAHKVYYVKKLDGSANTVTVDADGADLIDGAASVVLANQWDSVGLVSDGVSNWYIIEPAGWGGYTPPANSCWLYCVANRTTYGGTGAGANLVSPGGDDNTALGYNAMNQNTTGDGSVAVGSYALEGQAGQWVRWNVAVGFQAGRIQGSSEGSAVLIGAFCVTASEVYNSVVIGASAAYGNGLGSTRFGGCVYIGESVAGDIIGADNNVGIGSNAMYFAESSEDCVYVGHSAGYGTDGDSVFGNVGIGAGALQLAAAGADYNVAIGLSAAKGLGFTGEYNVYVGSEVANPAAATVSGDYNVGVGGYALGVITSGTRLVAVGYSALGDQLTIGTDTVAIGFEAGEFQQGSENVYIGSQAAEGAVGTATQVVLIGFESGHALTSGSYSTGAGYQTLANLTSGTYNTALGWKAGDLLSTGTHCILIGQGADPPANNSTYRLNIGDTIFGDLSAGNNTIGVNATTINAQLHVDQDEAAGARPVLLLDQADVDEPFMKLIGEAAATSFGLFNYSFIDELDVTTATRVVWYKVEIEDVGNVVADGDYYSPLFTLS